MVFFFFSLELSAKALFVFDKNLCGSQALEFELVCFCFLFGFVFVTHCFVCCAGKPDSDPALSVSPALFSQWTTMPRGGLLCPLRGAEFAVRSFEGTFSEKGQSILS